MDLFQCGADSDQNHSLTSAPLSLSCVRPTSRVVALEDATQSRSMKQISSKSQGQIESGTNNGANNNNNIHCNQNTVATGTLPLQRDDIDSMSYQSKDGRSISKFEVDLALVPQDVVYVRHGLDVDDKIRKMMQTRKYPLHIASCSTLSQSSQEVYQQQNKTKNLANSSKQQKLSTVRESSTFLLPSPSLTSVSCATKKSSPIRIFCKLEPSERFKVICFPRDLKSMDELLRIIETKLMFGVMGDRPGTLLLIVNHRASQPNDFVEIEDISSIRDEDRFVFLPYSNKDNFHVPGTSKATKATVAQDERLDLNYSITEGSPPSSPVRHRSRVRQSSMRPSSSTDEARISDWIMNDPIGDSEYNDDFHSQRSPTRYRSPHSSESLDWSLDDHDMDSVLAQRDETSKFHPKQHPYHDELRDGPPCAVDLYDNPDTDSNTCMYAELSALARELKKSRLKQELKEIQRRKPKPEALTTTNTTTTSVVATTNTTSFRSHENRGITYESSTQRKHSDSNSQSFSSPPNSQNNNNPRRATVRIVKMSPEQLTTMSSFSSRPPRSPRGATATIGMNNNFISKKAAKCQP
jgi:hypothetical protein